MHTKLKIILTSLCMSDIFTCGIIKSRIRFSALYILNAYYLSFIVFVIFFLSVVATTLRKYARKSEISVHKFVL